MVVEKEVGSCDKKGRAGAERGARRKSQQGGSRSSSSDAEDGGVVEQD